MRRCLAVSLGRVDYRQALELQNELRDQVVEGSLPNVLLLLEHPHVYTLGRRAKLTDILAGPEELSRLGAEVHQIDRGGEVTYHGPGQLVAYTIFDVRAWGGPLNFVSLLVDCMSDTLAEYGLDGGCFGRPTGVWVGDAKIGAIGLRISRGVATHGIALNVDPDLSFFDRIVPCGMPGVDVTSMAREGVDAGVEQVAPVLAKHFDRVFSSAIEWATLQDVRQGADTADEIPARR